MKSLLPLARVSAIAAGSLLAVTPLAVGHEVPGFAHSHASDAAAAIPAQATALASGGLMAVIPFALCLAAIALATAPRLRRLAARVA